MRDKPKKSFTDRLDPILKKYSSVMPALVEVDPSSFFLANFWAPLKLYCLAAYAHSCYVPIISRNIGDNFYFIDLLSNSGIDLVCKYRDCEPQPEKCSKCSKKHYIVGSPLIAATAIPPFKKMFFVDENKTNLDALRGRLDILTNAGLSKSQFKLIHGDCNLAVDGILAELTQSGKHHALVFIDNQGLDADWATINKLLEHRYCDLIINFPTSNVTRNPHNLGALKRFLGSSDFGTKTPLDYYVEKIRETGKTVETIAVRTGIPFHYDLIIVTKPDAKFSGVIHHIKENIERNTAREAENAFNILLGKQDTLTRFQ